MDRAVSSRPETRATRFSRCLTAMLLTKLAEYNCWANAKVLKRFDAIAANGTPLPTRALHLFSHVLNAQGIWIARISGHPELAPKVFLYHELPELHTLHENTCPKLVEMAKNADYPELARLISYTNSQGKAYETPVGEIMTHCFNHATYHRAQVALALREASLDPVNTDYVTWVRELMGQDR
jgi:uncharacterized damage-inducible protein DinB